jgi:hypothetical protein
MKLGRKDSDDAEQFTSASSGFPQTDKQDLVAFSKITTRLGAPFICTLLGNVNTSNIETFIPGSNSKSVKDYIDQSTSYRNGGILLFK